MGSAFSEKSRDARAIFALRRAVTDLMQIYHTEDADVIPYADRFKYVSYMLSKVSSTTTQISLGFLSFSLIPNPSH